MKHFRLNEFACPCCGRIDMDEGFLGKLDSARARAGVPFAINSGFRCEAHNKAVGSASRNHTSGHAADIACHNDRVRIKIILALIAAGFKRFGIYSSFVHADDTPGMPDALWVGR